MNILEQAKFTASVHNIKRFSKPRIQIRNSEVPDMVGRKTRRKSEEKHRILQNIRFTFHANAINIDLENNT